MIVLLYRQSLIHKRMLTNLSSQAYHVRVQPRIAAQQYGDQNKLYLQYFKTLFTRLKNVKKEKRPNIFD